MSRFRVIHTYSCEEWEVEAENNQVARKVIGWPAEVCQVYLLRRGPYAKISPPQVAVQLSPPVCGRYQICPDCNVTLVEKVGEDFWWQCPSCDLVYHEWENKIFRSNDI